MKKRIGKTEGFTLIELILVIVVLSLTFAMAAVAFGNLIGRNNLKYNGYQIVQNLREARSNSVIQKNDASWGLYFDDLSVLHGYTFFQGSSYGGRDTAFDLVFEFPNSLTFSQLNFGGPREIVFSKSDGTPSSIGNLVMTAEDLTYTITINALGLVDYSS